MRHEGLYGCPKGEDLHPERTEAINEALDRWAANRSTPVDRFALWADTEINRLLVELEKSARGHK